MTTDRIQRSHLTVDSPVGPLTLVSCDGTLCGLYMHEQRHRPADDAFGVPLGHEAGMPPFAQIVEELDEYFAGGRTQFDVRVAHLGTPFQERVWSALAEIPYGRTVSYGDIAKVIGQAPASRAVGMAVGRNPIGIVIPCHRVVGASGSLTGYAGGLDRKRQLLGLEREVASTSNR